MKILEILTAKRELGTFGERAAEKYYRRHGYRTLARNFVGGGNEIDLVMADKNTVAFVEVKTRTVGHEHPNEPRPASAVTKEKQKAILSCAKWFPMSKTEGKRLRFDVVEVYVTDGKRRKAVRIVPMENAFHA
ncbi:MAG: YraN family protein [Clostridia bacterium]|nr:YraN family protein [Clostridia bacterium]